MAYNQIKSLLAKKGWTGEEVGKALIASLLNDIKYQGQEHELLFTQADFDKMESSLSTERDYLAYGVYRDIYGSVVDTFNRGQGNYQQFYNGYYRYLMHLHGAMKADKALAEVEKYPLIMTPEQYSRVERETLEHRRNYRESFYSLLFNLLEDFLNALDAGDADKVPTTIAEAIEATKKVPANNQRLLSSYNELMGEGYYQLKDGRRSDQMSIDEWQNALTELYLATHKLIVDGEEADAYKTMQSFNFSRLENGYKLFFNGIDAIREAYKEATGKDIPEAEEQEYIDALEALLLNGGNTPDKYTEVGQAVSILFDDRTDYGGEWHYYEAPPEGLTQYDLLDLIIDTSRYADTDPKTALKEFKKDYPALYTALDTYIRETVPKAQSLKPTQLYKEFVSYGELAELDIGGYKTLVQPSTSDMVQYLADSGKCKFSDRKRAFANGIAVLQSPSKLQTDENGNYREESLSPLDMLESLDYLAKDEYSRSELERLPYTLFIPALSYLYAYNALIEIIGEIYDIPDMTIAQFDTSTFEGQLEALNSYLYMFYSTVYGDAEERARKRELVKELFTPVFAEQLKPTEEAKNAMRVKLAKQGISTNARKTLKDFDALIAELDNREGAC